MKKTIEKTPPKKGKFRVVVWHKGDGVTSEGAKVYIDGKIADTGGKWQHLVVELNVK